MLKAILFDLDGTLIDSEYFHFECWNELLAESNARLTYDDWLKNYAGVTLPVNAARLKEKYHIQTPLDELILRREDKAVQKFISTDVNLMPYAEDILQFFTAKGLTLAIVTSSVRKDVDAIFNRNGLKHYFKKIITRSEVTNSKPHPESYELCLRELGISAGECIVFEDTINGIRAAKAANLVCYAVQSNTAEHPQLQPADKIFKDFMDVKEYMIANGLLEK